MPTPTRTRLAAEVLDDRAVPAVLTVTNPGDAVARGDGVTLREAITAATTRRASGDCPAPAAGPVTIKFALGSNPVVKPRSALPPLTGGVTLDGTSPRGFDGTPDVVIDGTSAGGRTDGLTLTGSGNTVRGVVVNRFGGSGIVVAGSGNTVAGVWVGLDATGYRKAPNGGDGILVTGANNTVGGTTAANRVAASGNAGAGIDIRGTAAKNNKVQGCRVGTDFTGFASVANGVGILIQAGATGNQVGGTTPSARNVVTGNAGDQVRLTGSGTAYNTLQGNFVGIDATGESGAFNGGDAIKLEAGASRNTVGGTALGAGNLVGAAGYRVAGRSVGAGIELTGAGTTGNVVQGNWVGLDGRGTAPLANLGGGITVTGGAAGNTIGGSTQAAKNCLADRSNAPGLAATNDLLAAQWYTNSLQYYNHPERHGGTVRV